MIDYQMAIASQERAHGIFIRKKDTSDQKEDSLTLSENLRTNHCAEPSAWKSEDTRLEISGTCICSIRFSRSTYAFRSQSLESFQKRRHFHCLQTFLNGYACVQTHIVKPGQIHSSCRTSKQKLSRIFQLQVDHCLGTRQRFLIIFQIIIPQKKLLPATKLSYAAVSASR